jgi:hypothetical protein
MFPSTTGPTASVEEANQLIGAVLESGLADLFEDRDVKHFCLAQLHEYGCRAPANHVLMFCLRRLVRLGEAFAAATIKARLLDLLQSNAGVAGFFRGLDNLQSTNRDRNALKAALLAELAATPDPQAVAADMTTELEIVTALHASSKLAGLETGLADLAAALQASIEMVLRDLTDPVLRIAGPNGNWEQEAGDQSVADRLKYTSGLFPFRGREAEIAMLRDFLLAPDPTNRTDPFRWLLLTGPGGEGKSRLALEFCKTWLPDGWIGGRLDLNALRRLASGPLNWRPRKPTLFVVDYPAQAPVAVGELLSMLDRDADQFDLPVRVLLLERDSEGEWFRTMLPETTEAARIRGCAFRRTPKGTPVEPLAPPAIVETMADRFRERGVEPPDASLLMEAARRIDSRSVEQDGQSTPLPRTLFAVAAAELLTDAITDGQPDLEAVIKGLDREKVLASLVERDRAQRWRPVAGTDRQLLRQHETLYAFATMCLGLPLDALDDPVLDSLRDAGVLPAFRDPPLLDALASADVEAHLPALEPDILGEYFALDTFAALPAPHRQRFIDAAYHLGGDSFAVFCLRCLNDFPERTLALRLYLPSSGLTQTAALAFAGFTVDFASRPQYFERLDECLALLAQLQAAWPREAILALREAMTVFNVTYHASEAGDWPRVDAMLQRIDALRHSFSDDREIALLEASATLNIITDAIGTGEWPRVDAMLQRIDALHHSFRDDREIALQAARAAVNVTNHAGDAGQWSQMETAYVIVQKLVPQFPEDAELIAVASHAVALRHHAYRQHQKVPDLEVTQQAVAAARACIAWNTTHESTRGVGMSFRVIADAHRRFPDDAVITEVYQWCTDRGTDWSEVPPIT